MISQCRQDHLAPIYTIKRIHECYEGKIQIVSLQEIEIAYV